VRYLILSDLHGNWEAVEGVLEQSAGHYDRAVCCGDLVGYGADPNRVVEWVRANCVVVVRGNHDKACTGNEDLEWFNPVARLAALWTLQALTPANAEYVRGLSRGPVNEDGFQVVHGSPFDEDEYVVAADEAWEAFGYLESRVAFFGHTHMQGGFIWNHSRVETILCNAQPWSPTTLEIDPECAYLINPGSVGQPRDGTPQAAFALYDSENRVVTYCRAEYDVARAQQKIREAGLPNILAERLILGR
jgi:predicted phosphodiesterase